MQHSEPLSPQSPSASSNAPGRAPVQLDPELEERLRHMEQEQARREKWRARVWRERRALLALLGLVLLLLPNFRMARVVGRSMEPQFEDGQSLLVWRSWRLGGPLQTGDIIVFKSPEDPRIELVKRVVFAPGEHGPGVWPRAVATARGLVPTAFLFPEQVMTGAGRPPTNTGSSGDIWVIGDNLENSNDSRDFGPVSPASILGKVVLRP
jgi:signal peptidase I